MLRLLEEDRPAEAVPAAFEVVELTRELEADDNAALVTPLTNLATAQLRAGDLLGRRGQLQRCCLAAGRACGHRLAGD